MVFACKWIFARTLIFLLGHRLAVASSSAHAGKFAQVGEWLKPTDCKSVPPCEVRRFESFPVHQELEAPCGRERSGSPQPKSRALGARDLELKPAKDLVKRLLIALAAFVALGILSWNTISDQRIRLATLAVLAMFALKTWMRRKDVLHPDKD